jgi:hypothetical protein
VAVLRQVFQLTLTLLCVLRPGRSTVQGSLRQLMNSMPRTGSADPHKGRAISEPEH